MSKVLGVHVALIDDYGILHQLAPGDEVPVWGEGRIGAHCFAASVDPAEDAAGEAADTDQAPVVTAAVPDFTKKPVRRAGR